MHEHESGGLRERAGTQQADKSWGETPAAKAIPNHKTL